MEMPMNDYMHASFYWGKNTIILFAKWPGDNLRMYILALLVVFLAAAAVEFLCVPSPARGKAPGRSITSAAYNHTFVYGVRVWLSYLVMLSIMSFNVGVFISAVVGHAVGFYTMKLSSLKRAQLEHDGEEHAPNSVC